MGSEILCGSPFAGITLHNSFLNDKHILAVPCCASWLQKPYSDCVIKAIEDDNGNINIDSAWNSEEMKEFRSSIIDGSYKYCKRDICPAWISKSLIELPKQAHSCIQRNEMALDYPPMFVRVNIDPACNLACPTCRATKMSVTIPMSYNRLLSIFSSGAKELFISGSGELFINKPMLKAIREFSSSKYPDLKEVNIITNGTAFNKTMWYSLPEDFRKIVKNINVSMDAVSESTYHNIRIGSNFNEVIKNLAFVSSLRRNKEIPQLSVSFVLQKKNISELSLFIDFCNRYNADIVTINMAEKWDFQANNFFERDISLPVDWKTTYKDIIEETKVSINSSKIKVYTNAFKHSTI